LSLPATASALAASIAQCVSRAPSFRSLPASAFEDISELQDPLEKKKTMLASSSSVFQLFFVCKKLCDTRKK